MLNETESLLSRPVIYDGHSFSEQLQQAMDCFYNSFLKKEARPLYNNKKIFFDMKKEHKAFTFSYPERFLHIVSIDDDDKYDLFPCSNDISYENCTNFCEPPSSLFMFSALDRWECQYRLSRIHWIKEVIELANNGNRDISEWEEREYSSKGHYNKRLIRYNCGMDDYLIVLKDRGKDYLFITAYPLLLKRAKARCDKNYRAFLSKNKKAGNP